MPLQRAVDTAALMLRRGGRAALLVGPAVAVEEGFLAQELAAARWAGPGWPALGRARGGLGALRALPGAQLGDLDAADLVADRRRRPGNQQPVVELRVRKARRRGARVADASARAPTRWRPSARRSARRPAGWPRRSRRWARP